MQHIKYWLLRSLAASNFGSLLSLKHIKSFQIRPIILNLTYVSFKKHDRNLNSLSKIWFIINQNMRTQIGLIYIKTGPKQQRSTKRKESQIFIPNSQALTTTLGSIKQLSRLLPAPSNDLRFFAILNNQEKDEEFYIKQKRSPYALVKTT